MDARYSAVESFIVKSQESTFLLLEIRPTTFFCFAFALSHGNKHALFQQAVRVISFI